MKIAFTKKLRVDYIRGLLATILFSLLSSYLLSRTLKIKITGMGVKLGTLTSREEQIQGV